jgi:hypothetical protein
MSRDPTPPLSLGYQGEVRMIPLEFIFVPMQLLCVGCANCPLDAVESEERLGLEAMKI